MPAVDFEAVKKQLQLLGHEVDDATIKEFLAQMEAEQGGQTSASVPEISNSNPPVVIPSCAEPASSGPDGSEPGGQESVYYDSSAGVHVHVHTYPTATPTAATPVPDHQEEFLREHEDFFAACARNVNDNDTDTYEKGDENLAFELNAPRPSARRTTEEGSKNVSDQLGARQRKFIGDANAASPMKQGARRVAAPRYGGLEADDNDDEKASEAAWRTEARVRRRSSAGTDVTASTSSRRVSCAGSSRGFITNNAPVRRNQPVRPSTGKVDRVARHKQYQEEWSKRNHLGGKNKPRKLVDFRSKFAAEHALAAAEHKAALAGSRAERERLVRHTTTYQAPTSKRRDDVRWNTRVRMNEWVD